MIIGINLISILRVFWQLTINNIPRYITYINRMKMHYNIFFIRFFNKFILVNKLKRV